MGVLQLVNRLYKYLISSPGSVAAFSALFESLESYIWTFIRYSVDRVRHGVRKILNKLVLIYKEFEASKLAKLTDAAMAMAWEDKAKFTVLFALSSHGGRSAVKRIQEQCPQIAALLLHHIQTDATTASLCGDVYESLMQNDDLCRRDWIQTWIDPILNLPAENLRQVSMPIANKLLNKADTLQPGVFDRLVAHQPISDSQLILALMAIKKCKVAPAKHQHHLQSQQVLESGLTHFSEKIRVQTLEVIVASRSSREMFSQSELELIKQSVDLNMCLIDPSSRQDFVHVIKKMYQRMYEAMDESKRSSTNTSKALDLYPCFLMELGSSFYSCLFEGASFVRKSVALECLQLLFLRFNSDIWSPLTLPEHRNKVEFCLFDSYEENKVFVLRNLGILWANGGY